MHPTKPGPHAFIVRANTTRAPLFVCGTYSDAYNWCGAHRLNGHRALLDPPEGYPAPLPVHIDSPPGGSVVRVRPRYRLTHNRTLAEVW